ncbi:uncharacterized protein LOC129980799 [Argiope bruennichi]|uniref:uncharacterized protein LOC129980799 n=1 Tax=Argiope bruennichi TaxID=94029 RepID=UPI0024950E36|nr:uncharacterized protein LOC129980799 [Argiope bruennichi]
MDQALSNLSTNPNVVLQTFKVVIRGNGKKRIARAIIDTGSQRSYLLRATAEEMSYEPNSCEYLQHSLFGGKHTGELAAYNVNIVDNCEDPIEILIGADVAGKLMTGGYREMSCGLVAIETKLGWSVMGRITDTARSECSSLLVKSMLSTAETITDLWSLDTLGITDPSVKKSKIELQEAARMHFLNTVHLVDDRFEVDLPWLEDHPPLPDYFDLAKGRLNKTVKRLETESNYEAYENVFREWLEEGVIEEVAKNDQASVHYLPHRAVIKENSTTKIRPVFDASAKAKGFPSLNDCLEKGPNLIEQIPSILTRFRKEKIGVIADIRKAFLQIGVSPTDRDYLRFLWIGNDGQLKEYRHCRVVFGVSSSPFLLNSTIQFHLQTVLEKIGTGESSYPKDVIQKLAHSFYVDNCVSCVKNEKELHRFINVSTEVMAEKKFELRGWEFSDVNADTSADTNVLGLVWNKKSDTLRINTASVKELCFEKVTKRLILSTAHRLFDPLGICCPVIIIPKLLLQETWKQKITWDEEVDKITKNTFLKWLKDIDCLEKIRFPRYFGSEIASGDISVHIFCDASKHAYAVAAFIRIQTCDSVKVQLIQARSRVSQTGKEGITISRLELLAATVSARLSTSILSEIQSEEVYFWTDSSTVLTWIMREGAWNVFAQNRVKEIRALTNKSSWRHIPGSMNPADLPSRGCSAQTLLKSNWWLEPSWLYLPKEDWPKGNLSLNENEIVREKKKTIVSSVTRTEKLLIKMVQEDCFVEERDNKLKTLGVFKDQSGILRLKTKLTFRQDSEEFKTPAILPSDHEVVKRLIRYYHEKNAHAGTQILINILRERFWLLNARKTVRSLINKCPVCRRFSAKSVQVCTATPPNDRLREAAVFEICGIDFAGPVILKGNTKSWICLFTCAVYRAVHLELFESMSTESFLLALRRFISRRRRSKIIYCDNGTNFVGASNALRDLNWKQIIDDTSISPIQWKFNPPTASWWGGWWERLIGILKSLLRRVLGRASLTSEEMITILCDCEAVINSRPLTYVTENDVPLMPLSPSLFLQDIQISGVPDLDDIGHRSLNKRVKYRENLQKDLRKRFRSEYLGALIKNSDKTRSVKVNIGDVVLIGSD